MNSNLPESPEPQQPNNSYTRWVAGLAPGLPVSQFSDWEPWIRAGMVVLISVILLVAGLYLVISPKQKHQNAKWGYSFVSVVAGFWFGRGF